MAKLSDIDVNAPPGSETPTLGDDKIRDVKARLNEWALTEHYGNGRHKIGIGTVGARPSATEGAGMLYILTASGVEKELQYSDGSAWVTITKNQDVVSYISNLTNHAASNPIDHVDGSVTGAKIAAGVITAPHFHSSIQALVNGSDADAFHSHASMVIIAEESTMLFTEYVAGDDSLLISSDVEKYAAEVPSNVKLKEIRINRAGALRIKFDLVDYGAGTIDAAIFKNGVQVGITRQVGNGVYTTFFEDIANWNAGDLCQLYYLASSNNDGAVKNFRIYVANDLYKMIAFHKNEEVILE